MANDVLEIIERASGIGSLVLDVRFAENEEEDAMREWILRFSQALANAPDLTLLRLMRIGHEAHFLLYKHVRLPDSLVHLDVELPSFRLPDWLGPIVSEFLARLELLPNLFDLEICSHNLYEYGFTKLLRLCW